MEVNPKELKPYEFNKKFFDMLPREEYSALKKDIEKRGITNDLHITKSNVILCGHQRHQIALDLGLKKVPCKLVDIDENDKDAVKLYVIKDNLLRRHLKPEKRAILEYEMYKTVVVPVEEQPRNNNGQFKPLSHTATTDVYKNLAKDIGQDRATLARHIQYAKAVEKEPERFKGKSTTRVLKELQEDYKEKLPFRLSHKDMILNGTKTQTSRIRDVFIKSNDIVIANIFEPNFAKLKILEIKHKSLSEFTNDDAKREGYKSLEDFKEIWKQLHDKWQPELKVQVISFKVIK